MLEIRDLCKSYTTGDGTQRIILDKLNLTVQAGEKVAILGPSGSGKTTLLNLIGTLDKADKGEIFLNQQAVFDQKEKELATFRNQSIGFIFQLHHLLPQLNLMDNILLPTLALKNKIDKEEIERANRLIQTLGLEKLKAQKPGELSGGECQRAAVARALINQPQLLLADEPTGALDQQSSLQLSELLVEINEIQQTSMLVVTHSLELAKKMDKIYTLEAGKLKQA